MLARAIVPSFFNRGRKMAAKAWMFSAAIVCLFPFALSAQQPPVRYECDFGQSGSRNALRLEFIYDQPQNRAYSVGNNGISDVYAYSGSEVVSFLEFLPTGAVQTTTIDARGRAVHSRHTYSTSSGFIQSQSTGLCVRR